LPISILDMGNIYCCSRGFVFFYSKGSERYFGHLDLDEMRLLQDTDGRSPIEAPVTDGYVYLKRRNSMDIDIYSTETHSAIKTFTLTERSGFWVKQIVRIGDLLVVRSFNSDVLEVYDFETGKKLFDQRIEQIAEDMFPDKKSGRLAMMDVSERINIWEISGK